MVKRIKLKLLEHKVNAGDDCGTFLVHALPPPLHVLLYIHPLGCPPGSNIFLNSVVVKGDDNNATCFPQRIDKILKSFLCQSFAAVLFTLGLLAYPAGWGSKEVVHATITHAYSCTPR